MLKVAMIGCGGIGYYHLGHLKQYGDIIELVGMCDIISEKAEEYAEEVGCKAYTDYKAMLDDAKPEAVFICVPPDCHGEIENDLIDRNIPFFVEKPLALDIALAKQIEKRILEKNLITAVGFQCRYDSLAEHVKAFAEKNTVPFIDCTRFGGVPEQEWWKVKERSGGQLVEQTVHQLDYIRYAFGEPDTVFSMAARGYVTDIEGFDTDDLSATVVRFENGTLATIATGCYAKSGDCFDSKFIFSAPDKRGEMHLLSKFEIFGEVEQEKEDGFLISGDGGMGGASDEGTVIQNSVDAGLVCDRTFLEAVISGDGSKIRSPYSDGLKSVAFGLACNKSMETGLPVKISEFLK